MKKLNLNTKGLKQKKLQLIKSKVSNLNNEELMKVLGGATNNYYSCVNQDTCGVGLPPTGCLASCFSSCVTYNTTPCTGC